ncbi:MAG: two-component regulator propeller domain-containing protein [Edaphobacter sp.]
MATLDGIARFDGVRFKVFNSSNTPEIETNRFSMMVKGEPGDLWLYGEGGIITRLHNGKFSTLGMKEGVTPNIVYGITTDNHGHVWILRGQSILEWNEESGRFKTVTDDGIQYRPLNWDGTGFWGMRAQKLFCFHYGELSTYDVPVSLPMEEVKKVAVGGIGDVWLAGQNGRVARLFEGKWQISSQAIQRSFMDSENRHWKTSIDTHLDRTIYIPTVSGEKGIRYNGFVEDDERNVWIGSEGQGLFRIQPEIIHMYTTADGLVSENIYPIIRDRHDEMWVGSWPAGLTRFHNGMLTRYTPKDGLPGLVSSLADDDNGNLWVGTHGGLAVLSKGKLQRPEGLPSGFPVIQAILQARDGEILFGTQTGIDRYMVQYNKRSLQLEHQLSVHNGDVRVIIEGKNGDIWFGGYGGLSLMHHGSLTHWTKKDGLPSNMVRAVYEDPQGVIWVGTYDGGLGRYADGKWTKYSQRNGLFDDGVFQILEDGQENLWMSSNRGIFRVSKRQLEDVAAGRQRSVISVSYGRNDGMLNIECNGGLWPAGAKDKDGHLWFPTQEGVAVVSPEAPSPTGKSPRVVIESIVLDHVPVDLHKPLTIRPGQGGLEIQYTGLSFARPEQIVFRYMMEGLDKNWEHVGYRRTAYFSHLPPGNYTFRVIAASSDGVWSKEVNSMPIIVLPPFYLTRSFIATVSVFLILAIFGFWSYRIRQLRIVQAAQQAFSQQLIASQEGERRRIAAELHDSLGQHLVLIKNYALLLLRNEDAEQTAQERREGLAEIRDEVSQAIDETRTISYNLRPFQLDRLGLSTSIEALIDSVSKVTDIIFSTKIDDIDAYFPEDLRINFYRIVQEILNNMVKHSDARHAKVCIERTDKNLVLSISDNGKGFSPNEAGYGSGKGGFGLAGIRERALLLGGKVVIQSQPGYGTTTVIEFTTSLPH